MLANGFQSYISECTPNEVAERALQSMYDSGIPVWYAHNLGKYDGLFIASAAMRLGWYQEATLAGGNRVISLTVRKPGEYKRIEFRDSYALVPSSLADCANDFELPSRKIFTKSDYSIDPRKWNKTKLRDGCFADCRIILELLETLGNLVDSWGGQVKRTFSSTALSIVKSDLKSRTLEIPSHHKTPWANERAAPSYYGARVEVIRHMPQEELTELDVCSSYPSSMAQPLPWLPLCEVEGKQCEEFYRRGESMIIRAKVTVPDMYLPPLPFRVDENSGVFFPTGTWEAWFPACELQYAESIGCKVKPLAGILYTTSNPFASFINTVYQLKSTATGALRRFAKDILNGAYGKFGEKPEHCSLLGFPTEEAATKYIYENPDLCTPLLPDSDRLLSVESSKWANHAHYGIASYITGRSRILLHRYATEATGTAYFDTDSVHCVSYSGKTGKQLGQLKVEIARIKGKYYAPKIYELEDLDTGKKHFASKGFPVNEKSFGEMLKSAIGESDGVKTERMRLLKGQMRAGNLDVARIKQVKAWRGLSMKRAPISGSPDGDTRPWSVEELREGKQKEAVSPWVSDRLMTVGKRKKRK